MIGKEVQEKSTNHQNTHRQLCFKFRSLKAFWVHTQSGKFAWERVIASPNPTNPINPYSSSINDFVGCQYMSYNHSLPWVKSEDLPFSIGCVLG